MPNFTLYQLGYSILLVAGIAIVRALVGSALTHASGEGIVRSDDAHRRFWINQLTRLGAIALLIAGIVYIWSDHASSFVAAAGILTAGVAIALQRVVTAIAGYFIILRGRTFTVGDRITIGGVRGDVIALGPMQTTVMEMGEPPSAESGEPKLWVDERQYTGRMVRVTNDKLFDTPVYNYTREFAYMWEEMHFPLAYGSDHAQAEAILLDVARSSTASIIEPARLALHSMRSHYYLPDDSTVDPRVYLRLTEKWIVLSLRYVSGVYRGRELKDAMSREILERLMSADIQIADNV